MPFKFSDICTLLNRLEDVELLDPQPLAANKTARLKDITQKWFISHQRAINELDPGGGSALLSALLSHRRTDRVYGIQSKSLCRILSRSLSLGEVRARDLQAYTLPGRGDLATCLERVLIAGGPPAQPAVSLDEVEDLLRRLAGQCRFSGPEVRLPSGSSRDRDELMKGVFRRVSPIEGKWLARLILKDFSPVKIDEDLILKSYHFLLPVVLRFQDDFELAIAQLQDPNMLGNVPGRPDPRSEQAYRDQAASKLKPVVGTKVGRPYFHKARSIDHCLKILGSQPWVLERKYDGEYCEIHIDLARSSVVKDCIQIFSKSRKDSTADRKAIHQTLVDCLRLGSPGCRIKRQAILLGELVVFSTNQVDPLPFEKLRSHVSRSGSFLGTDEDSMPSSDEHLGIVFFDLLLLDNEVVMRKPIEQRRQVLRNVYEKLPNRAQSAEWKVVDFGAYGSEEAVKKLVHQFAASIATRCEGLVLKPCNVPYFSLAASSQSYKHSFTKVKKDYIAGAGDEADLAVIGASYDAQQAAKNGFPGLRFTEFFLACLTNKDEVLRFQAKPHFRVVGTIQQDKCIPMPVLKAANSIGNFSSKAFGSPEAMSSLNIELSSAQAKPDVIFTTPLVFEVLGSGFEKASNARHMWLRHARVKKLHEDRHWIETCTYQDLQEQAKVSREAPVDSESQETLRWIERLEATLRKKFERERTVTPRTSTTTTSPDASRMRSSALTRAVRRSSGSSVAFRKPATPTTTKSSSMILSGNTLVETRTAVKRTQTTDTPCPAKKPRLDTSGVSSSANKGNADLSPKSGLSRSMPLGDITNTVPLGVSALPSIRRPPYNTSAPNPSLDQSAKPVKALSPKRQSSTTCKAGNCLLSQAVVYLVPCIAKTLYITDDLLPDHECPKISDLNHWNRDAFASPAVPETVSESQAYKGLRKIVLVEAKRSQAVKTVVEQIERLNDGKLRERVEVYDWRVLEICKGHDRRSWELKRFLLGATIPDDGQGRACFVQNPSFGV